MILVRVKEGVLRKGAKIQMMSTKETYTVDHMGVFSPKKEPVDVLYPGEVGFITAEAKAASRLALKEFPAER